MSNASLEYIEQIAVYMNENGESKTLKFFNITPDTLHRYLRKKKFYETKQPKVLLLDIETTPMQVHAWGCWKQKIGHEQIINDWFLLSYAAKWLFDSKMHSGVLTPKEAINKNDSRIARELWKLMDAADIIIAHNGLQFDIPRAQTRFIMNKLAPPSPFQVIDTYLVARKNFRFGSNKLDYIGRLIRNKGKVHTEYQLWLRCLAGEQKALNEMLAYNKEDVLLLEEGYVFLRPYIKNHPNMAIFMEAHEPSCPNCGSADIDECGYYTTSVNRYLAFRCKNCGAICRNRKADIPLKMKSGILRPVAR